MSFLAFDPDQLQALVLRTRMVLVDLASLPTDDPTADAAARSVRSVLRTLELGLLPAVRRVLDTPPLRAPIRPGADLDSLPAALARAMAVDRGWAVAIDPLADDPTRITTEEVVALADRLNGMLPRDVVDDPEASAWLAQELNAIAADPALCRLFDHEIARWQTWAELMATRRIMLGRTAADAGDDVGADVTAAQHCLDRLVLAFSRVAGGASGDGADGVIPHSLAWMDDASPYAAAMFLAGLDLPPARFVDVALRVLRHAPDPRDGIGDTAADLVLRAALANPGALPAFAIGAVSYTNVLRLQLHDPALLAGVLVRASDPRTADPATAAAIVVPVLRAAAQQPIPSLRRTDLADLVAPWTAHLLTASRAWGLSPAEGSALLRGAVAEMDALQELLDRSDVVIDGARRALVDGPARSVADLDQYLGAMGAILMNQHMDDAGMRRKAWDTICNLGGLATAFVPWAALGLAATAAVVVVHNQHGPDLRQAQADSLYAGDAALAQAGATVVSTMYEAYVREGRIPADMPPPPAVEMPSNDLPSSTYLWHFLDWEMHLPGGEDGPIADSIRLGLYSVISPSQIGEHTWWWVDGFPGS